MPKIQYLTASMGATNLAVVHQANDIIANYQAQGYKLTLRQLFYQFVSRALIANTVQSYKRLGDIVNDGRLMGLIDWDAIEDRTRGLETVPSWDSPADIINACAKQFQVDMWENQDEAIEIWVEKEALAGVIEQVANRHRVPYLSCRGYTSQSEMWRAGMRLLAKVRHQKKNIVILHLGDHDPSGIDMSRDIQDRLHLFMGRDYSKVTFKRLALNYDQVEQYNPPPNPAKVTDSRYAAYEERFGTESWELDALEPRILDELITEAIELFRDEAIWEDDRIREEEAKTNLNAVGSNWELVLEKLGTNNDESEEQES